MDCVPNYGRLLAKKRPVFPPCICTSWQYSLVSPPIKTQYWDFPGGPVVKTLPSRAGGVGSIPGWGAGIPHATQPKSQNIKKNTVINSVITR